MPRSTLNGMVLLAGCAAGIFYGYYTQHTGVLASFHIRAPIEMPSTPAALSILGIIRAIDPLQKTITLELASPYKQQQTFQAQVQYDDLTTLKNAKDQALTASQLQIGQTVTAWIARREGPLHLSSIVLFQ